MTVGDNRLVGSHTHTSAELPFVYGPALISESVRWHSEQTFPTGKHSPPRGGPRHLLQGQADPTPTWGAGGELSGAGAQGAGAQGTSRGEGGAATCRRLQRIQRGPPSPWLGLPFGCSGRACEALARNGRWSLDRGRPHDHRRRRPWDHLLRISRRELKKC